MLSYRNAAVGLVLIGFSILTGCQSKSAGSQISASTPSDSSAPSSKPTPTSDSSDSAVRLVRNGVLSDFNSTTVGKAFEGTFQNAKWSSFVTAKGQKVVQFDGFVALGTAPRQPASEVMEVRDQCKASLGLADTFAEIRSKRQSLDQEYKTKAREISQRYTVVNYRGGYYRAAQMEQLQLNLDPDYPEEPEAYQTERIGGRGEKPYHDLFAAWKNERDALRRVEQEANDKIGACTVKAQVPVRFQFLLSVDVTQFRLSGLDPHFNTEEEALSFIYR